MGAKIPCYFSAHGPRRTALVCQAGPAAAASFAFRRLLTRRLNPHLFKCLWLFITDLPVFSFPEARLHAKVSKSGVGDFRTDAVFHRRQKYSPLLACIGNFTSWVFYRDFAYRREDRNRAPRGKADQSNCNVLEQSCWRDISAEWTRPAKSSETIPAATLHSLRSACFCDAPMASDIRKAAQAAP